jgi:hypothetical protein
MPAAAVTWLSPSPAWFCQECNEIAGRLQRGVTGRFVQNCTLSHSREERGANIAQRPESRFRFGGGPHVIAGQGNVLPAERGDMRQQVIRNGDVLRPKLPHGAAEIGPVTTKLCVLAIGAAVRDR